MMHSATNTFHSCKPPLTITKEVSVSPFKGHDVTITEIKGIAFSHFKVACSCGWGPDILYKMVTAAEAEADVHLLEDVLTIPDFTYNIDKSHAHMIPSASSSIG